MSDSGSIRTEDEDNLIEEFLSEHFPASYHTEQAALPGIEEESEEVSSEERGEIERLIDKTNSLFNTSKGTLGLAIDFVILAEELSQSNEWLQGYDPEITREDILERYENTAKSSLTLKRGNTKEGIRSYHNDLIDLFREEFNRTNFPSSPGHHTGEWERYDDLLEHAFRLSRPGRYEAVQELFDVGLRRLDAKEYERRTPPFPNPFLRVLQDYQRSSPDEEGGAAYQALCYGYVKAEWPHLSLRASKVRTGSSRQHRYGDIDGYYGPDLMISVEVKDRVIDATNVDSELGTMVDVAENTTAISIAICREITTEARNELTEAGVLVLSDDDLADQLQAWDYHKQNRALHGMVHFFANIEENPAGVQRLLRFVKSVDPENTALAHLNESGKSGTGGDEP